jgi:DNA-binding response OmpR family regulator
LESSPSPGRILLVDDLALFRRILPVRLGPLGRTVESVADVSAARAYLAQTRPDLILLDVIMPGVDGLTYCRELKADPKLCDIPVIILTDLRGNAHERSLEARADDYLPKRANDAVMRIRVQLQMHLIDLRKRDNGKASPPAPASILLASPLPNLRAQLPAQFSTDGHDTHVVSMADEIISAIRPEDRLLILDMNLGLDEVHYVLSMVRMEPETAQLPVLLLCEKEELDQLVAIEFMVDDVLWKPLKAQVTRHRLQFLLELGQRALT